MNEKYDPTNFYFFPPLPINNLSARNVDPNKLIPFEHLLPFDNKQFVENCGNAIGNVSNALDDRAILLDSIANDQIYYDKENKLSPFELHLTKFIVAYQLFKAFITWLNYDGVPLKEDGTPRVGRDSFRYEHLIFYYKRMYAITKRDSIKFEYCLDYDYSESESLPVSDWSLKLNEKYISTENSKAMQQINTPAMPQQMPIEPIIWTGDKVLLGYMIQWLKDNGLISQKTGRDSAIESHFVDERNQPIKNIKQGLGRVKALNDGGLPKSYEKIEPLLKKLNPNKRKG
jgi:hypothetical protein